LSLADTRTVLRRSGQAPRKGRIRQIASQLLTPSSRAGAVQPCVVIEGNRVLARIFRRRSLVLALRPWRRRRLCRHDERGDLCQSQRRRQLVSTARHSAARAVSVDCCAL